MVEKINLTFLGTGGVIPTAKRNHMAILLNYKNENILIDCGEGTQRQFRRAKINPGRITRLLITHWHGDHILGIPGLLQTLALSGYKKTLYIYGPKGTEKFMKELLNVFHFVGKISIRVQEVNEGTFFENEDFYLEAEPMSHGIFCNAYNFVAKGKIRIDKRKLAKLKLPSGPLLKNLKLGKNIIYNGKKYIAKSLTYNEGGKKISFVLDTGVNKNIIPFVKGSALLVIESTYGEDMKKIAEDYKHLTSTQAAEIGKKARVKELVLTHISQRYDQDSNYLLQSAKKVFNKSHLVNDLDSINV